jgi:hypothetical protein
MLKSDRAVLKCPDICIHKFYLGFRTDRLKTIVTYVNSVMQLKCDSVIIFG